MIVFLYGPDSYRVNERLNVLRDGFQLKYDEDGHHISSIDGNEFNTDEFRAQTKSAGLFTAKRFVVIRHPWKIKAEERDQLLEELNSVDEDTIIVFAGDAPPRKNDKLFKRLLKADLVETFEELSTSALQAFITQRVQKHGATIDSAATQRLSQSVGNDLWRMSNEIKRLANYTKQIDEATVSELIDELIDDNIFDLTDALGQRNLASASRLLGEQFDNGANEQYLITMLGRHVATLLKVKQTGGEGLKMHPYVMEKAKQQSGKFEQRELLTFYWRLLEIDHDSKSTSKDVRTLLDLFIIEACAVT